VPQQVSEQLTGSEIEPIMPIPATYSIFNSDLDNQMMQGSSSSNKPRKTPKVEMPRPQSVESNETYTAVIAMP
jgi:hypothetical protein